jgi:hypothetical protein
MEEGTNSVEPILADIRKEWHWVKPGLVEIQEGMPSIDELPEDVYAACVNGQAHLWVHPSCFMITKFVVDNGRRCLLLWKSWAREKGGKSSLQWHSFFEALALQNDCSLMVISTPHAPLVDYCLTNFGYKVETYTLTKQIGELCP